MKTQRNIFLAFLLNLAFALFEFVGGLFTGSIAIASDAVHDLGDAVSIGLSWLLERKSRQTPDERYTYGYARFSVLGGLITTLILLVGSMTVSARAVYRLFHPTAIHYGGMIFLSAMGVCVNLLAAYITREGDSINQKAVNLHMLEDVLGWVVVFIGSIVMHFTGLWFLDPLMSIGVSLFLIFHAGKNLGRVLSLFLEKAPADLNSDVLRRQLLQIDGILDVHHIHIRSIDGVNHDAAMHIVTGADAHEMKHRVREALATLGIRHATLELEAPDEHCHHKSCPGVEAAEHHHHHH